MKNIFVLLAMCCLLSIPQVNAQIPTTGLKMYLPFNGTPHDVLNANTGNIFGGVTLTNDRFGNPNSAYLFNGSNGFISLNNIPAYSFPDATISLWFKSTGNGTAGATNWSMISQDDILVSGAGFLFDVVVNNPAVTGNSRAEGHFGCTCSTEGVVGSSINTGDGNWHHLVVASPVFESPVNRMRIYIDGVFQGTNATIPAWNQMRGSIYPFNIGRWAGGGKHFGGVIDDIRVYNTVLTQSDATSLYNECPPVGTACDDGLFCTSNDAEDGNCNCAGTSASVDDGIACTADACDETNDVITHTPNNALCDDGNPNTIDVCDAVLGCQNNQNANIPTLSEWGLIIFALLLLCTGAVAVWKSRYGGEHAKA